MMNRRLGLCFRWGSIFLLLSAPAALFAQDNAFCAGYDNGKRIVRFGSNAVSSERAWGTSNKLAVGKVQYSAMQPS